MFFETHYSLFMKMTYYAFYMVSTVCAGYLEFSYYAYLSVSVSKHHNRPTVSRSTDQNECLLLSTGVTSLWQLGRKPQSCVLSV